MGTYYRPTRSGRKSERQPRTRDFKRSTFITVDEDGPENRPDADLPRMSVLLLSTVISRLTSKDVTVDPVFRQYYTIGTWESGGLCVTSFCTQPDISTCMCSVRGVGMSDVRDSVSEVCSEYHDYAAPSFAARGPKSASRPALIQLSGRLAPHAFEKISRRTSSATCVATFCNLSRCRIGFVVCSDGTTHVRSLGMRSIQILRPYFPSWSGCILHSSLQYYRVLCRPKAGKDSSRGDNSGILLYVDGRVRFQGTPDVISMASGAVCHAIGSVMRSSSWFDFVLALEAYDREPHQQVGNDTTSVIGTVTEAESVSTLVSYR